MTAEPGVKILGSPGGGPGRVIRALIQLLCLVGRRGTLASTSRRWKRSVLLRTFQTETTVIGNFWTQLYDAQQEDYQPAPTSGLGMFVEVKDPEHKIILAPNMALKACSLSPPMPPAITRSVFTPIPPSSPFLPEAWTSRRGNMSTTLRQLLPKISWVSCSYE